MIGAAQITLDHSGGPLRPLLQTAAPLPLDRLLIGRPVAEAADLLPRLFSLCRHAQSRAARLSLGLPDTTGEAEAQGEILRDHLARLCQFLPRALGLAPVPPGLAALGALLPDDLPGLPRWMGSPGMAPRLAQALHSRFAPGEASTTALPPVGHGAAALLPDPCENSPAGRQAAHPLLQEVEKAFGRGPLWRLLGLLLDMAALQAGKLPPISRSTDGTATVPASRGLYALRLQHAGGIVTGITRRTPTDHILAPGGALLQALACLPATKAALAPVVLALHDPCIPVQLHLPQTETARA